MTSATDNLGPHLLGRVPSIPDERNYPMSAFLGDTPTKFDVLMAAVDKSHSSVAVKALLDYLAPYLKALIPTPSPQPTPTPTPVPPIPVPPGPAPAVTEWLDSEQLDQGQTPHCVGFRMGTVGKHKGLRERRRSVQEC